MYDVVAEHRRIESNLISDWASSSLPRPRQGVRRRPEARPPADAADRRRGLSPRILYLAFDTVKTPRAGHPDVGSQIQSKYLLIRLTASSSTVASNQHTAGQDCGSICILPGAYSHHRRISRRRLQGRI